MTQEAELLTCGNQETAFLHVILRNPVSGGATKNLVLHASTKILRGVYPELIEGLRMTVSRFRIHTYHYQFRWRLTWK